MPRPNERAALGARSQPQAGSSALCPGPLSRSCSTTVPSKKQGDGSAGAMCCEPQRLVGSFCLLVPLAWCWLLLPARSIGVGWRSIGPWPVRAAARRRRLLDLELIRELLVPVSTGYTYMRTLNPADITAVQVTYANNIPSARLHEFSVVLSKKEKERGRMKTFSLPSPSLFSSLAVEDLAERPGRGSRPPRAGRG